MQVEIPKALSYLFEPARYKVAYGGRGGAKSWSFARALLILGRAKPMRVLCAREIQKSIKDSVHQLLRDQIDALKLDDFYTVKDHEIEGKNGTLFLFEGLRYNVRSIKSLEGIDIAAVFEAANVSHNSWETLIPTIRKPGSEIWLEFNPELESDETYKRFVVESPSNSVVRKISWRDNPWFPDVLRQELEDLKRRDEDAYLNVWEGHCRVTLEGAIYAQELREATKEGRITHVPYDKRLPVHTYWDFGFADMTSTWFVQKSGFEYHVIDFYQNRLQQLPHYLNMLQERKYVYGTHFLPHDAEHEHIGAPSIRKQFEAIGHRVVVVQRVPKIQLGINATRSVFNRLYFDDRSCADGLQALRHYAYKVDEHGQWSKDPNHDVNSHAADALRTLGESVGLPERKPEQPEIQVVSYSKGEESAAWMG